MDQWVWTYGVSNFFNIPHSFFHPKDAVIFMYHFASFLVKEARLTSSHQVVFEAFLVFILWQESMIILHTSTETHKNQSIAAI